MFAFSMLIQAMLVEIFLRTIGTLELLFIVDLAVVGGFEMSSGSELMFSFNAQKTSSTYGTNVRWKVILYTIQVRQVVQIEPLCFITSNSCGVIPTLGVKTNSTNNDAAWLCVPFCGASAIATASASNARGFVTAWRSLELGTFRLGTVCMRHYCDEACLS